MSPFVAKCDHLLNACLSNGCDGLADLSTQAVQAHSEAPEGPEHLLFLAVRLRERLAQRFFLFFQGFHRTFEAL
jgi:hypothetical protein